MVEKTRSVGEGCSRPAIYKHLRSEVEVPGRNEEAWAKTLYNVLREGQGRVAKAYISSRAQVLEDSDWS